MFFCNLDSLLKSKVDGIDVLDHLKVLLNCHIHYAVVNSVFLLLNKCVKLMFLSIPDSVMNSHM